MQQQVMIELRTKNAIYQRLRIGACAGVAERKAERHTVECASQKMAHVKGDVENCFGLQAPTAGFRSGEGAGVDDGGPQTRFGQQVSRYGSRGTTSHNYDVEATIWHAQSDL
jgi:hypothetical protein